MDRRYRHWRFRQGSRRATQTPSQKLLSHPEGTVQLNAWLGRQDTQLPCQSLENTEKWPISVMLRTVVYHHRAPADKR